MFALVAAPRQNVLRGLIPRLFRRREVDSFHALERARSGAKTLDAFFERPDWDTLINPDSLNVGHYQCCVLGQVFFLSYSKGCEALGVDEFDQAAELGFNARDQYSKEEEFRALTHAWLVVLNERWRARGVTAWAS